MPSCFVRETTCASHGHERGATDIESEGILSPMPGSIPSQEEVS